MNQPNEYNPSERRPIATRDLKISHAIANTLARMGCSANGISIAGMVFALVACVLLIGTAYFEAGMLQRALWLGAAVLVQMRLLANLFDGMVAVASGKASRLGELYNEVPDRVSDAAVLIGLGFAYGSASSLGFAAASVAVFVAYVRAQAKVAGAPQDYCGPMAKQQRMALVTLVCVFLAFTPTAWHGPWEAAAGMGMIHFVLWLIVVGGLFTALRRLVRAGRALREGAA